MSIEVRYFARYREVLGVEKEQVEGEFPSVDSLRQHLLKREGVWQVLAEQNIMCARNEDLCKLAEPLEPGDVVAFFPVVTGG